MIIHFFFVSKSQNWICFDELKLNNIFAVGWKSTLNTRCSPWIEIVGFVKVFVKPSSGILKTPIDPF